MKTEFLRATLATALLLTSTTLLAADSLSATNTADSPEVSSAIDEVLALHRAGVDPGVIVGHLRSLPELPRLCAADIIELKQNAVSPDVMSALILMSAPDKARLSADDIVQLHTKGVPSDIISAMITKARKTTEAAAQTAALSVPKTNQKFRLVMPQGSSLTVIPYRPQYYNPYYRGYCGPRYYGPTWSYGYGYGPGYW
jgi:hypothetical protein